jgi:hypothetical protein
VILWTLASGLWSRLWATAELRKFLRHFSKGEGDYLVVQERIFKRMGLEEIYKRAEEHHRSRKE